MFDLIHPSLYFPLYINLLLIISISMLFHTQKYAGSELRVASFNKTAAFIVFVVITLFIGLRPISGRYFGDMGTYTRSYIYYINGGDLPEKGDLWFNIYMKTCASVMDVNIWFLLTAFIYIGCLYFACKRMFPDYVFIAFLMCITTFSFWGYAVNGIRNGMATSIVVLALSYYNRKLVAILLCILAVSIHKSMILPCCVLVLVWLYSNTRLYMIIWLICIILSNILSGFFEHFFSSMRLVDDDRFSNYLTSDVNVEHFSSTGFRWDFLLYSAVPIVMGYYVTIKKNLKDRLYLLFLNTYIVSNAFWILVIKANFSNRFAYLSWFLYPLVLIYPAIKLDIWKKPYTQTGIIIFLHLAFTYIMWIIKG